jgi:hypothetical protein
MPFGPSCAPDSPNSLPADGANAWCDEFCPPCAFYAEIGYLALRRQDPGFRTVAVLDTQSGGIDTGNVPNFQTTPRFADFHDLDPDFMHGVRATLGYHWDRCALEFSGFYLGQSTETRTYAAPGMLDTFFNVNGSFAPQAFPLGFEGNNGLWLQADVIRTFIKTAMGNGEANFRCWPSAFGRVNFLCGVRYVDMYERIGIFTGDDDFTQLGANGLPNPALQATFTTTAHNHIIGPQTGVEWNWPVCCWLAMTGQIKGAWGANFVDVNESLVRGDGFPGPAGHRSDTEFSQVYEAGFYFTVMLKDNIHLRAGYDLLWLVDIVEASTALDFNLANTSGIETHHGSAFYHGPQVEFHILF